MQNKPKKKKEPGFFQKIKIFFCATNVVDDDGSLQNKKSKIESSNNIQRSSKNLRISSKRMSNQAVSNKRMTYQRMTYKPKIQGENAKEYEEDYDQNDGQIMVSYKKSDYSPFWDQQMKLDMPHP